MKLLELLFRVTKGQYTPEVVRVPGVTSCDRWCYRYDEDGRFYARPLSSS